jgi:protein TonB
MKNIFLFIGVAFTPLFIFAQTPATSDTLPKNRPDVLASSEVYMFADTMPDFPGGEAALVKYLSENVQYPEDEKKKKHEGMVVVSFIVEADGSISHVQTIKGVENAPGLSVEAERVIKAMPAWNPGKLDGKAVRVKMMLPVKFIWTKENPEKKTKEKKD